MDNTKPSSLLDKFVVRFNNAGLRDRIKDRAKADHRAMNDVVNFAVERYLQGADAFDRLLQLVENSLKPTGTDGYIPVKKATLLALYDACERGRRLSPDSAPMVAVSTILDMEGFGRD